MTPEKKPGRPRSETARKAILSATARLLEQCPIRELTIEGIAKEAGVGKPTIYRWWDGKCSLVMDAFFASAVPRAPFTETGSVIQALTDQVRLLIRLLAGPSGRIIAEMIGEGQAQPQVMQRFRERFFSQLLDPARSLIERGKQAGEIDKTLDTELAIDLIYGPIYYRLLIGHQPLDDAFISALPARVMAALSCGR